MERIRFLIGVSALLLSLACRESSNPEESQSIIQTQLDTINRLNLIIDSLSRQRVSPRADLNDWITPEDISALKTRGIKEPLDSIPQILYNHPEILPYEGVLGGVMRFNKIELLGDQWAIGEFEDGHVSGLILLKYTVAKDSTIRWTVLDHYIR